MTINLPDMTDVRDESRDRNIRAKEAEGLRKALYNQCEKAMAGWHNEKRNPRAGEQRQLNAAEALITELDTISNGYVDRTGVVAPEHSPAAARYGKNQPLASGQSFAGYAQAMGHAEPDQVRDVLDSEGRELSLTKYLKGAYTGDWRGAEPERLLNALSGGSAGAGGVLLPTVLTTRIIDIARNKTRVHQAGAQTVPMENRTVDVARWLTDPTLAWRAENAAITESDPTMDKITLAAKSLASVTRVSRELVEDTDVENQLEAAFGSSLAISVDTAALYGTGASNQPTGVKNTSGVTKTPLATNGLSPTWAALVNSVGRLRDVNEEPTAQIASDRSLRALALLTGSDGQYVNAPSYLDGVERYATAQVPNNLTVGSSNVTSDIFTADWTQLLIGVRTELQITLLTERYMPDAGQYGFVAWWRGDIAVARPKAFDVVTGVLA